MGAERETRAGNWVRVEVKEEVLERLIRGGQLCLADIFCPEGVSKKCLWRLCLRCCARKGEAGQPMEPDSFALGSGGAGCGKDRGSLENRFQTTGKKKP